MLMIAHRGRCVPDQENSIAGLMGLPAEVDGIEIDVRVSRDGVPLLMHDSILRRVTGGAGRVEGLQFKELQQLHLHGTCEPPPRLIHYLNRAAEVLFPAPLAGAQAGRDIYLDIKCAAGRIGSIVRELQGFPFSSKLVWLVREGAQLEAIQAPAEGGTRVGILGCTLESLDEHLILAERYAAEVVFVRHGMDAFRRNADVVPEIKAQGIRAGASIINGAGPLEFARKYGCDVVLTDFVRDPDRV